MFLNEPFIRNFTEIEALIRRAFAEDFVDRDITSIACIPEETYTQARLVVKQKGCIAGLRFVPWIFQMRDPQVRVQLLVRDGQMCEAGTVLAWIEGPARSLLSAERVALNFLQHLSGVATLTAQCVEKVQGTRCKILDTRKTWLGARDLQKYAVRMGGGTNHRSHLADQILIKNNHLVLTPLSECVRRAREQFPLHWIEVEIDRIEALKSAMGADAILLDNMRPAEVRQCVEQVQGKVFLEASGGIRLENLADFAATGVDAVSIGALTHSAPALDISMRIHL